MSPAPQITLPDGVDADEFVSLFSDLKNFALTEEQARIATERAMAAGKIDAFEAKWYMHRLMHPEEPEMPTFVNGQAAG